MEIQGKDWAILMSKQSQRRSSRCPLARHMDGAFFPEYASASMSEFSPLSDADCLDLFGTVPQGTGIVSTGKRRGNQIHGEEIFALRNQSMCLSEIGIIARREKIEVVMLACRTY